MTVSRGFGFAWRAMDNMNHDYGISYYRKIPGTQVPGIMKKKRTDTNRGVCGVQDEVVRQETPVLPFHNEFSHLTAIQALIR